MYVCSYLHMYVDKNYIHLELYMDFNIASEDLRNMKGRACYWERTLWDAFCILLGIEEDLWPLPSEDGDINLSAGNDKVEEDSEGKGKCKLVWYFNSHRNFLELKIFSYVKLNDSFSFNVQSIYVWFFTTAGKYARTRKLKHDVIEEVNMLLENIGICHEQIAEQAVYFYFFFQLDVLKISLRVIFKF